MTFLQKIGQWFTEILHVGTAVAVVAAPIVDVAVPSVAQLYNFTVQQAVLAESAAAGAPGAGPQKLASVLAAVEPYAIAVFAKDGIAAPTQAQLTAYINAVVASLNTLPEGIIKTPVPSTAVNAPVQTAVAQ